MQKSSCNYLTLTNVYPKGIQVTDKELEKVQIQKADFHGEWNYTILPLI